MAKQNETRGLSKSMMKAEENEMYIRHSLELFSNPALNLRLCQPEDIRARSIQYFEQCVEDNMKPNVAGYALCLGCTRQTLINCISGATAIPTDNQTELIRFYSALNSLMEDYLQNNKMHPIAGLFLAKNNYGYKDTSEVVQVDNRVENTSPEKLIEESKLLLQEPEDLGAIGSNDLPTVSELLDEQTKETET